MAGGPGGPIAAHGRCHSCCNTAARPIHPLEEVSPRGCLHDRLDWQLDDWQQAGLLQHRDASGQRVCLARRQLTQPPRSVVAAQAVIILASSSGSPPPLPVALAGQDLPTTPRTAAPAAPLVVMGASSRLEERSMWLFGWQWWPSWLCAQVAWRSLGCCWQGDGMGGRTAGCDKDLFVLPCRAVLTSPSATSPHGPPPNIHQSLQQSLSTSSPSCIVTVFPTRRPRFVPVKQTSVRCSNFRCSRLRGWRRPSIALAQVPVIHHSPAYSSVTSTCL